MLTCLELFRDNLDDVMHKCMHKRIVLYGYGYSGKFIAWYAEYYHGIKVDYIITQDWSSAIPYEFVLYRDTLFDFGYKDIQDAIVWLCLPEADEIKDKLISCGYVKNKTYYDFGEIAYGENYKEYVNGVGDVQFFTWLEHKFGCDYVTAISLEEMESVLEGQKHYCAMTPKELFPLLDKCHCMPGSEDAIFDFGCGKGAAMTSFLDYGFKKVGGVEYQPEIYNTMLSNFEKLGMDVNCGNIECIHGDAATITEALDGYNWFYYFDPFRENIFVKTIQNICDSIKRKPRKVRIISINPLYHKIIEEAGMFVLTKQFDIMSRQRVVDLFVTKKEFEHSVE